LKKSGEQSLRKETDRTKKLHDEIELLQSPGLEEKGTKKIS